MRNWIIGMVVAAVCGASAWAQDTGWGDLDALILGNLPQQGEVQSAFWLPDHADPTIARHALAVVYAHIPGSAGSVGIDVALFMRDSTGWQMARKLDGIFGFQPRDVLFVGDRIEVTTTTPGPDDPRCCPTQESRFSILRTTGEVTQLR